MKIANRYEIIKAIGKGGMANVYLANDLVLNRQVAIKILKGDGKDDPIALERFKREAHAYTELSHPNAVDVYDVGDEGGYHYIVMEYVKGHTLKELIKRRGPLNAKEAVWIIKQLAGALLEAHKNGVIHRDIKSQNVLIKDDGTVKLADFGIAIVNNAMQITSKGSVLGSVHYLAPELSKGANASMQSDIYSLGIVFYELLTGDVPYKGDTPVEVALKHVKNDIPSVRKFNPSIPQAVENIVIKATARKLENRYSNVALMIKDLNRCLTKEAKNDPKLVFNNEDNSSFKNIKMANNLEQKKKEDNNKFFNTFFIIMMSLLSIAAVLIILFLTGIIGKKDNYVIMPDIENMTVNEARDYLANYDLLIDDSEITWVLTEDKPINYIVSYLPEKGTSIEKGSKIKLTVSEGQYLIMGDYVGSDIEEAKKELKALGFNVLERAVDSTLPVGTIISQSGIKANEKYNPSIVNNVILEYSALKQGIIPYGTLGKDINEAYNELIDLGYDVEINLIDINELNDTEKAYGQNKVVRVDPIEGTLYIQSDDNKIKLYYYN